MQRTLYNDGVEVGQDDLANTEATKSEEILKTRRVTTRYGVIDGLIVSLDGTKVNIDTGHALFANGEVAALDTPLVGLSGATVAENVSTFVGLYLTEVTSNPKPHEVDPVVYDTRAEPKLNAGFFVAGDAGSDSRSLQLSKAVDAELKGTFILLAEIVGQSGRLKLVEPTPLPRTKGGHDPYRDAADTTALQGLYAGMNGSDTPAEADVHPIATAEDHFHRSLVGRGTPKATNPHGLTILDIEGEAEEIGRFHANGIIGLDPGDGPFPAAADGSFGWNVGPNGLVIISDLLLTDAGVNEILVIRGHEVIGPGQISVLKSGTTNLNFRAATLAQGLYYIVCRWDSNDPEPVFIIAAKADFDALCVASDGTPVWVNNAVEETLKVDGTTVTEKKFYVLGLVNWSGTDLINFDSFTTLTVPEPGGNLVYDKRLPDGHAFKLPSGVKALDLRRFGTITNEQVQKHTIRQDRIVGKVINESEFIVHSGARVVGGNLYPTGLTAKNHANPGGDNTIPKHLTDADALSLWQHRGVGGGEHPLATETGTGFQAPADKWKQNHLTMTLLKFADMDSAAGTRSIGDAVGTAVATPKGAQYMFVRSGVLRHIFARVGASLGPNDAARLHLEMTTAGPNTASTPDLVVTSASPSVDTVSHYEYLAGPFTVTASVANPVSICCIEAITNTVKNVTLTAEFHFDGSDQAD